MLKKLKLRKYKEIYFVDCENVGYLLPRKIPETSLIYMFVSDPYVIEKLQSRFFKQVVVIDLSQIVKNHAKNAMDFCIVSKIGEMLKYVNSTQKMIIVSKDKGYDAAIDYMKNDYPFFHIERYPFSLIYLENNDEYRKEFLYKMDDHTLKMLACCHSMKQLKQNLSKKQKQSLSIVQHIDPISGIKVMIEYDFYQHLFSLYYSGNIKKQYQTLKEAKRAYDDLKNEVTRKYQKYFSKEMYKKAKQLQIHHYIEEAYASHLPLQECLIEHFGQNKGVSLFQTYVH